ncbi:MAG: hypothetical protein ACK4NC_03505 [Candidatus Gracilibacteria bacterium]
MFKNILTVLLGLAVAFITMMIFEFVNSLFFPFPAGMNINDISQVRAFTQVLPWTAYILVLTGWATGSLFGGYMMQKYNPGKIILPVITGILLSILGVINFIMLTHPIWVIVIGILLLFGGVIIGYRCFHKKKV